MRPHPITVALALIGIGITVAIFFLQAMKMEVLMDTSCMGLEPPMSKEQAVA